MIDMPPEPPPAYEETIQQRLEECGLKADGLAVSYADDLQEYEIVIGRSAEAKPEHFACIREAAGYNFVHFDDDAMLSAYNDHVSELVLPQYLASAEARLKEQGLWDGLPVKQNYESLELYVESLEEHVGLRAGSALRVEGESILFAPSEGLESFDDFAEHYANLLAIVAYVSARDHLSFGFIGNERSPD